MTGASWQYVSVAAALDRGGRAHARLSQLTEAEQLARNQQRAQASISELAALFLFTTRPTDSALAGWDPWGDPDEQGRLDALIKCAARGAEPAADIIELVDTFGFAEGGHIP